MSIVKIRQNKLFYSNRISRRELLKLGTFAAAGLGAGALLSGCSAASFQPASTPAPTATLPPRATNTPEPTATFTPTNTPLPTITTIPTYTPVSTTVFSNNRTVSTQNKRVLRILEMGKQDGIPILYHHGTPESRLLFDQWYQDAASHGIRLIGYDRPGYGDSTAYAGRSVASAAEDVSAIVKELGINKLMVVGISGGGPHALACAALLPDLVVAAAVLASPAPYNADGLDWFSGLSPDNVEEFQAALKGADALRKVVDVTVPYFKTIDPASFYSGTKSTLSASDASLFTESLSNYLLKAIQEGLKNGSDGWVEDDLAIIAPWGFDPSQIKIPTLIIHNEQDVLVPFLQGKWLASKIKNAETRFGAGGHLPLLLRIPEANNWLLSKWK
jgi:pimeloyl-ACP methyl ester carboxylesterase